MVRDEAKAWADLRFKTWWKEISSKCPYEDGANCFVYWYNDEHLHSGIHFVAPADLHQGKDVEVLAQRHQVYLDSKAKNPEQWFGSTRNWSYISEVALNKGRPTKTTLPDAIVVT